MTPGNGLTRKTDLHQKVAKARGRGLGRGSGFLEGSKGARSWIGTRIRARARFENYVLADAARSDPSIGIEICLSGRKDRFGITKTIGKPTTGKYF